MGFRDRGIEIKTPEQIDLMRVAGSAGGETLELLRAAARPGVTTEELDTLAETNIRDHGGVPSFLGYGYPPFPATICASVNDEVVHGIPGDRGAGRGRRDLHRLRRDRRGLARRRRDHGRRSARSPTTCASCCGSPRSRCGAAWPPPGSAAGSPTSATRSRPTSARQGRYGILEDYTGHGIGTEMHMAAQRAQLRPPRPRARRIVEGLALAVEPMVTLGQQAHRPARGRVDRRHGRRLHGRPLRAHLHRDARRAPGCSPPSTAARPGWPSSASHSADADRRFRVPAARPWETDGAGGEYSPVVVSSARCPRERRPVPLVRLMTCERKRPPESVRCADAALTLTPKEQQRGRPHLGLDRHRRGDHRHLHLRPRSWSAAGRTSRA